MVKLDYNLLKGIAMGCSRYRALGVLDIKL